jgi:hypothetical protein
MFANTVEAGSAEAPDQRLNARVVQTAGASPCWNRMYGSLCRPSPRQERKAQKKSDPRPMLIIGIGF